MKYNIFVHDILMKDLHNEDVGLTDEDYVGVGVLYGFKRFGMFFLGECTDKGSTVVGDIYNVEEDKFEEVNRYYIAFGYTPMEYDIYLLKENKDVKCFIYVKEEDMINKNELKVLGSDKPFEWLEECFSMLRKEFEDIYTNSSDILHIKTNDIDSFKSQVEEYAERNPDAKIYASGFVLSTEHPELNKKVEIKKE